MTFKIDKHSLDDLWYLYEAIHHDLLNNRYLARGHWRIRWEASFDTIPAHEDRFDLYEESLKRGDIFSPICVLANGSEVIDGRHKMTVARDRLGWNTVPVARLVDTETKKVDDEVYLPLLSGKKPSQPFSAPLCLVTGERMVDTGEFYSSSKRKINKLDIMGYTVPNLAIKTNQLPLG